MTGREAPALRAAALSALPGIRHGFFTRQGGVSEGLYRSLNGGVGSSDRQDRIAENRGRMAAALAVPSECLITAYQIHSPDVVVADAPWSTDDRPRADAIVTGRTGLAIGVSTADCGPVLFFDPQARIIGAAHAGWRGALTGVLEATVVAMERLGAAPSRIVAALGPMIRQPHYEVGPDLIAKFVAADAGNAVHFSPALREGHAMFDLAGYIVARLGRLRLASVEDIGICTYADEERFFSYRRATHRGESDYGRHVNAIALAEP